MQFSNGFFIQFIRLAGPFWHSENKSTIRSLALALFMLTVMQIGIAVVITIWSADLFNALEQRSMSGLLTQIGLIVLIFAANIAVTTAHFKVKRRLQLDWRSWLTHHLISKWMTDGRHYLVTHIQGTHDNPDGRIAEDIRIATESAIELSHSLLYCLLLLISFTQILWTLSGTVTVNLLFIEIPVHGHLVWLAIIYAACASSLGWWLGRPYTMATDDRQTVEANFRFGLVTARENSLAIALVHGEANEQNRFIALFNDIVHAWQRQTLTWSHLFMLTSGYSVLSMAFPILVSAPRYILGSISLGALMQSAQAFQQTAGALSWPVDNMARVAEWRASVERVLGLVNGLNQLEQEIVLHDPHRIHLIKTDEDVLRFRDTCIIRLDGVVCVSAINVEIRPGERVLVSGNVFTGSKLFKAIVGLWPWGEGAIELPRDPVFFMPPRPYLPTGTLRAAICYPSTHMEYTESALEEALELVGLEELKEQLDHEDNWAGALSREQQQRLGVVRLLLQNPKWILLQESMDSLDSSCEMKMLRLIAQRLPDAAILTITNEPLAEGFHQRRIEL
ncbi:MAG: ABC transporter ATP-binding protein/permease [Methylobacter sp.]|uniref:ABC transporter ATP-binding protein/permease n=1 Tax=Methylobacter sp. TaxID=2051955 RepID=UPI0025FDB96F|nr:ABC transporter ATP-binding protein/permease [Methylobacter sp.]MCK9622731.1 ABC transporter ATP-binding protein/permease [Methylobacter sp.]